MIYLLWTYLAGVAASVVLSHGLLQNPKCAPGANANGALLTAALWPIFVLFEVRRML